MSNVDTEGPSHLTPEHRPELAKELERMDDVELNYTKYLDGNLSPALETRVDAERARIQHQSGLPDEPSVDDVKTAWADARTREPQPEDVKLTDRIQADYALVKNVAWARELDAARARAPANLSQPRRDGPSSLDLAALPAAPTPRTPPAAEAPPRVTIGQSLPSLDDARDKAQASPPRVTIGQPPMSLDELREKAKTSPEIQAQVTKRIALLRDHPDLQTDDGRRTALKSAQSDMERAASLNDKKTERQLRIQLLALDDLTNKPRPRPLPTNDQPPPPAPEPPRPSAKPLGPVIATEQMPQMPARPAPAPREAPAPPAPLATEARALPNNSLEPTDPIRPPISSPARFEVRTEEPRPDPALDDGPTAPGGQPNLDLDDGPTTPVSQPDPNLYDGTTAPLVRPPSVDQSTLTGPKQIAIGNDAPTLRPQQDQPRPPIQKPKHEQPSQPEKTTEPFVDPPTAPARASRPTPQPQPNQRRTTPDSTKELDIDDIVLDEPSRPYLDKARAFDRYFEDMKQNRALVGQMRDDAQRLDRLLDRAPTDAAARALAQQVQARAAVIRSEKSNNDLATVERQYRTLQQDERRPEATGNLHQAERIAFSVVRAEIVQRERLLAERITTDRMREVMSMPAAERATIANDAAVLMSTLDPNVDESPYNERPFIQRELREHDENDAPYARVCALIAESQRYPDNYLAFQAQVDPELLEKATARGTALLDAPADETDAMLRKELAQAKVALALAKASDDPIAIVKATNSAAIAAYVYDTLPQRRSYEINTGKFTISPR